MHSVPVWQSALAGGRRGNEGKNVRGPGEVHAPGRRREPAGGRGADRIRLYDLDVTCEGAPEEGTFVDAEDAGASGLRNVGGGEWAFSWLTQRSWSGTCRDFVVEVDGGPAGFLRFDFR